MNGNSICKKLFFIFFSVSFLLISTNAFSLSAPATSNGDFTVTFDAPTASSHFYTLYQTGTSVSSYPVPNNVSSKTYTNMPSGTYHYKFDRCNYLAGLGTFCDSDMGPLPTVTVQVTNTPPIPPVPGAPGVGPSPATDQTRIIFTLNSNETSSQIQESKNGSATWTPVTSTGTYWNDIYLTRDSGSYRYRRNSCNANGCSAYSTASASITVQNIPDIPSGTFGSMTDIDGSYIVNWMPRSTAAEDFATYITEKKLAGSSSYTYVSNGLSISESGMLDGTHIYRTKACNPSNLCSAWSTQYVTVEHPPSVPVITAPSTSTTGSYSVELESTGVVDTYELQEQTNGSNFVGGGNNGAASEAYQKTTDAVYGYIARACNTTCSAWSAVKNVQVLRTPSTPSNFTAPSTNNSGYFSVNWSAASGTVDSYELVEGINGGQFSSPLLDLDENPIAELRNNLPVGTYEYQVRACNTLSCSPWSSSVFTEVSPTVAVIDGPSTSSNGTFTLTWTAEHQLLLEDGYGKYLGTSKTFTDLPSGVYNFSLDYCYDVTLPLGESGGTTTETFCEASTAETKTVVVTRDAEPAIDQFSQEAGTSTYTADVSQRGGAIIAIPLQSIPGINGFQPNLFLAYDSASATDVADTQVVEGALGYGWRLGGLPRLHRCRVGLPGSNKVLLHDSDRLCLDGMQLKNISGNYWSSNAEYRTEVNTFVKVTPYGSGFEVRFPDGKVAQFGVSSNARVDFSGTGANILEWNLESMTDPMAGSMSFSYRKFDGYGVSYLQSIDYAGASVELFYGPRSDLASVEVGPPSTEPKFVKRHAVVNKIVMSNGSNNVREYRLDSNADNQGRVRLENFQECGFDQAGGNPTCYRPLSFIWGEVAGSVSQYPITISNLVDGLGANTAFAYVDVTTTDNPLHFSQNTFGPLISAPNLERQSIAAIVEMQRSNGNGGINFWTYNYKDFPQRNTNNRGYAGFYEFAARNEQSGNPIFNQIRMDFPFIGTVSAKYTLQALTTKSSYTEFAFNVQQQGNGVVLPYQKSVTNIWQGGNQVLNSSIVNINVCFKNLVGAVCPASGSDGEFITQIMESSAVGEGISNPAFSAAFWGDVPQRQLVQEEIEKTVVGVSNLLNTTNPWAIGAVVKQSNTHSIPNLPSKTVINTASYIPGTLVLQTATEFEGESVLERTLSNAYNGFNLSSVTIDGIDGTSRGINYGDYVDQRYPSFTSNLLDHTTNVDYDLRFGQPKTILDPNDHLATIKRDNFGRVIDLQSVDGTKVVTQYERCDLVSCPTEVTNVAVTKVTTTATNNSIQVAPVRIQYFDNLARPVLSEVEAFNSSNGWRRQLTQYDDQGRVDFESLPYFSTQTYSCNPANCIDYQYDLPPLNSETYRIVKPEEIIERTTIRGEYTFVFETISSSVNNNSYFDQISLKRSLFNRIGQLIQVDDLSSSSTSVVTKYQYDALGNLIEVTVDDNVVATMTYDLAGNRLSITDVSTGTINSEYSSLDELIESSDAKNQVTKFQYDILGRVTYRIDDFGSSSEVTNTYAWDPINALGGLASRSNGSEFTESYTYSPIDSKLETITTAIDVPNVLAETYTTSIGYDSLRRPSAMVYPNLFQTTQTYNGVGYVDKLFSQSQLLKELKTIDHFGNATQISLGNGLETNSTFDVLGRLESIQTGSVATPSSIQDLEYQWKTNSQLLKRTDKRGTFGTSDDTSDVFSHDQLGRVTSQTTLGGANRTLGFEFDNLGNLTSRSSSVSGEPDVPDYSYNNASNPYQLSSASVNGDPTTFHYDASGNMTRYQASYYFDSFIDYDSQNRVKQITVGNSANTSTPMARDEFWYDPDGNRYLHRETWQEASQRQKVTSYVGNFEEIHPDTGSNDVVQTTRLGDVRHIREVTVLDQVSTRFEYIHRDHLGSVDAVTDENGNLLAKISFDPFGNFRETDRSSSLLPASGAALLAFIEERPARGYTDHEHLTRTGFIHMNGRVYDPRIGRFISPDPIVQAPNNSQSYNRYAYVMNNPMALTDPSGFSGENFGQGGSGGLICLGAASCNGGVSYGSFHYGSSPGTSYYANLAEGCCLFDYSDRFVGQPVYGERASVFGGGFQSSVPRGPYSDFTGRVDNLSLINPNGIASIPRLYNNISFSDHKTTFLGREFNVTTITISVGIGPKTPNDVTTTMESIARINAVSGSKAAYGDQVFVLNVNATLTYGAADFYIRSGSNNFCCSSSGDLITIDASGNAYNFPQTSIHELLHGFGLHHRNDGTGGFTSYDRGVRNGYLYDDRTFHFQEGRLLQFGYRVGYGYRKP